MQDQHELPRAQRPRTYNPLSGLEDVKDESALTPQELFKKLTGRDASDGLGRWEMYALLKKAGATKDDLLTVYTRSQINSVEYHLRKKNGATGQPARREIAASEDAAAPAAADKPAEPVASTAAPNEPAKSATKKELPTFSLPDILDDLEACAALLRDSTTYVDRPCLRIIARSLARDVQELKENLL
jgi:hypothetical protein